MAKGEADTTLGNRAQRPPERMTDERGAGPIVRLGRVINPRCRRIRQTKASVSRAEAIFYRRDDN
jgi:hypothetical protein